MKAKGVIIFRSKEYVGEKISFPTKFATQVSEIYRTETKDKSDLQDVKKDKEEKNNIPK